MALVALKCPHCGADIDFDNSRESGFCTYCGSKIINENVKTMRLDNSEQFRGALSGALNCLIANDMEVAEELIDEAIGLNGNCSDALFVKSAIFLRKDYAKANTYYELATKSDESIGLVSRDRFNDLIRNYMNELRKESNTHIRKTLARDDLCPGDLDNCRLYVEKNVFCRKDGDFPYFRDFVKKECEADFAKMENIIRIPNTITQEHWDALRTFDREYLLTVTTMFFANPELKKRYAALILSYAQRLENKWAPLLRKGPVNVDRGELSDMKRNVKIFVKWIG